MNSKWQMIADHGKRGGRQWQRREGDEYEMVQYEEVRDISSGLSSWLAWHARFRIMDYGWEDIEWALSNHNLAFGRTPDDVLAAALFENHGADFSDCEQFFKLDEAIDYCEKFMADMTDRTINLSNRFQGIDETCPLCGAHLDGYDDLSFESPYICVSHTCHECHSEFHFNYELTNAVIDGDGRFSGIKVIGCEK